MNSSYREKNFFERVKRHFIVEEYLEEKEMEFSLTEKLEFYVKETPTKSTMAIVMNLSIKFKNNRL